MEKVWRTRNEHSLREKADLKLLSRHPPVYERERDRDASRGRGETREKRRAASVSVATALSLARSSFGR